MTVLDLLGTVEQVEEPSPVIELRAVERVFPADPPVHALHPTDLLVEAGEYVSIIGPSGSGKSSLLNLLGLLDRPTAGEYLLDGLPTAGIPEGRRAALRAGHIGFVFQSFHLMPHRTVLENVLLGAHSRLPGGPLEWSLRMPRTRRSEKELRAEALDLLERHGLAWAARKRADELSHGLHKGIELCRALLMKPKLLLLDEPAAGLPHSEVETLIATVRRLRNDDDITVVIVEHNMGLIAALTDRVVVLDHGAKLMEGTAAEAQSDPRVIEAYIGKDAADDAA